MKAIVAESGRARTVDIPFDRVAAGTDGVVVNVTSAGICGSDLHLLSLGFSGPVLGHEFGGRLDDGTLVAVRPTGECGSCPSCTGGRPQLCGDAVAGLYGTSLPGGLAEQALVDPARLVVMPAGADERDLGLVEPLAVAVHGVSRGRARAGDRVLVIGAGSIGLLTVAALRHRGIDVDLVARHPHQRRAGESLGAGLIEPGLLGAGAGTRAGDGYDLVFDAVSTQQSLDGAVDAARPGGTVVEFGMFWSPVTVGNALLLKEITLVPTMFYSHGHDHDDFAEAAAIVASDAVLSDVLVTHRFDLADGERAFDVAADRAAGSIKVHVIP